MAHYNQDEEFDFTEDDLETLERLNDSLANLNSLISTVNEKSAISKIKGTKFELFHWTFTEGKRFKGNDWSVPIPDGFKLVPSDKEHPLRAIPIDSDQNDEKPRVEIIGGAEAESMMKCDEWLCHRNAREGVAALLATHTAEQIQQITGATAGISTFSFDHICGFVNKFAQTLVCRENCISLSNPRKTITIRVNVCYTTDAQDKELEESLQNFLSATQMPGGTPKVSTKFESKKVFDDLIVGKTASLDSAIEEAKQSYNLSVNGVMSICKYMYNNELYEDEIKDGRNLARSAIEKGMEVAEFFYKKADELVEKLKAANASEGIMNKAYSKLIGLLEAITEITGPDNKPIRISMSKTISEIRKRWNAKAPASTRKSAESVKGQKHEKREAAQNTEKIAHEEAKKSRNLVQKQCDDRVQHYRKGLEEQLEKDSKQLCDDRTAALKEELKKDEVALEKLGAFKFSAKKALRKQIIALQSELDQGNESSYLKDAIGKMKSKKGELLKQYENDVEKYLNQRFSQKKVVIDQGKEPYRKKTVSESSLNDSEQCVLTVLGNSYWQTVSEAKQYMWDDDAMWSASRIAAKLHREGFLDYHDGKYAKAGTPYDITEVQWTEDSQMAKKTIPAAPKIVSFFSEAQKKVVPDLSIVAKKKTEKKAKYRRFWKNFASGFFVVVFTALGLYLAFGLDMTWLGTLCFIPLILVCPSAKS